MECKTSAICDLASAEIQNSCKEQSIGNWVIELLTSLRISGAEDMSFKK